MQAYSNPKRESDPYSLPDIEVFRLTADEQAQTAIDNDDEIIYDVAANVGQIVDNVKHMSWFHKAVADEFESGWFWWSCFPGCLPDSEPNGPFKTQAEALADARDGVEEEIEDDETEE